MRFRKREGLRYCLNGKGYFKSEDKYAVVKVARAISDTMVMTGIRYGSTTRERPIVVMCIGTDRSTGDSLGPLVGDMLTKKKMPDVHVFGTLDYPVHARNLEETLKSAYDTYGRPYIIAVDASLGILEHVGCISVGKGPIKPGAGLKKELPAVGDLHITGVVNTGGFMDFLVLQSTRLSVVMKMADVIARGLHMAFNEYANLAYSNSFYTAQIQ